jgi:DNA-binding FrmR family transcriptional regulator
VNLSPTAQREIVNRLRRARGQLDGVLTMIESDRPCGDIVTQLAAASHALNKAAYKLIAVSMQQCLVADSEDQEMTPEQLEKLFISLA